MAHQVADLEAGRVALGYDQINLLSESAGTRTAMIYAWRHPEHPPLGDDRGEPARRIPLGRGHHRRADRPLLESVRRGRDLRRANRRPRRDAAPDLRRHPRPLAVLPIKDVNVKVVSVFGLIDSTAAASPTPAPMTLAAWLSAADGDASGLWFMSVLGDLLFPEQFVRGQYAAAAMLDAQAARDFFARGPGDVTNLARSATAFTRAWPAHRPRRGAAVRPRTPRHRLARGRPRAGAAVNHEAHMDTAQQWALTIATPIGRQAVTLILREADGRLQGEARGTQESVPLIDLTRDGERLTWSQRITRPMRPNLRFDVSARGDQMVGTSKAGRLPSSTVTGVRTS